MWDWSQEFRAHTPQHLAVVLVSAAIIAGACVIGARLILRDRRSGVDIPQDGRERRFRVTLAWVIIASQVFINARRFLPSHWDLGDSLPLHFCRLSVWIAPWLLLTLDRRARALSLFWGVGLSAQIFATPYLEVGHGDLSFWIYWINHIQIVGVAAYDIVVLGYRPNWKDFRFASVAGVAAAAIIASLNAVLGTNYSYLGAGTHEGTSIVDEMGTYPWRLLVMALGGVALFAAITGASKLLMLCRTRLLKKPPPRTATPD